MNMQPEIETVGPLVDARQRLQGGLIEHCYIVIEIT